MSNVNQIPPSKRINAFVLYILKVDRLGLKESKLATENCAVKKKMTVSLFKPQTLNLNLLTCLLRHGGDYRFYLPTNWKRC